MPFKEVEILKCYIYDKSRRKGTEKLQSSEMSLFCCLLEVLVY